jgi:hypothetical protein
MGWISKGHFSTKVRVEIVDGVPVPDTMWITATNEELGLQVEIDAQLEQGRMVATRLLCETSAGDRLTTELVRRVPLANLLRGGIASGLGVLPMMGKDLAALRAAGPVEETLKTVAIVYRLAYLAGDPPTAAVRSVFELPKSTASRWVQMARSQGHLGKTSPRTAGV